MTNKMKSDNNNKKEDGHFKKKNIKHNPIEESSRAVFSEPRAIDIKES
jgi:hypothetical protein